MKYILRLYIYGQWHIALCAVLLYIGYSSLHSREFHWNESIHIGAATLFVYLLHRYLSAELMSVGNTNRYLYTKEQPIISAFQIGLSFALAVVTFFHLPFTNQVILIGAGIISVGYITPILIKQRLRDIGQAKIFFISFVWAIIPVLTMTDEDFSWLAKALVFIENFAFIFALTIPFDVRDKDVDKKAQISNLSNKLSKKQLSSLLIIFQIVMAISIGLLFYLNHYPFSIFVGLILFYMFQDRLTRPLHQIKNERFYLLYMDGLIGIKGILIYTLFKFL